MEHVKGDEGRTQSEEEMDLRRGPWTVEEDFTLINYIAHHGEGRWNSLARCAGLKRTGKSCRLRWLNYLRPDVRRGNITLEEQLMILELHSRWGNRWSKIAQHLPGRTDNEIKNYWRTRVQKHAKQLKCDVNSKQFKDTMRYLWMPRLVERIQAAAASSVAGNSSSTSTVTATGTTMPPNHNINNMDMNHNHHMGSAAGGCNTQIMHVPQSNFYNNNNSSSSNNFQFTPENSCTAMAASSDSFGTQVSPVSDLTDCYNYPAAVNQSNNNIQDNYYPTNHHQQQQLSTYGDTLTSPTGKYYYNHGLDFQEVMEQQNSQQWMVDGGDVVSDSLWNVEDVWFLPQQLGSNNI